MLASAHFAAGVISYMLITSAGLPQEAGFMGALASHKIIDSLKESNNRGAIVITISIKEAQERDKINLQADNYLLAGLIAISPDVLKKLGCNAGMHNSLFGDEIVLSKKDSMLAELMALNVPMASINLGNTDVDIGIGVNF